MNYVENLTSVEGGYGRTGSRSPMQWDDTKNAGFSSAEKEKLYIPQDSSPDRPTVSDQMSDENSLYNFIKSMIDFRMKNPALQSCGEIEFKNIGYPLVFERTTEGQKITVVINPSADAKEIEVSAGKVVFTVCKGGSLDGNILKINGTSAVFIEN